MTYDEIKEKVFALWAKADGNQHDPEELEDYYDFRSFVIYNDGPDSPLVEYIEQEGGGEGGAEDCHAVIKVEGVYYKFVYWYRSFDGYTFDEPDPEIVHPVERLVTFYE